ncbi:hypothetical protein LCGC14_1165350 [marine sediment metagenome]|uniref:Uncharacterized protein n=1 Tax=marine sediment metagenome TaxID=412755 RepID=A0A0F9PX01_9ZZZZ
MRILLIFTFLFTACERYHPCETYESFVAGICFRGGRLPELHEVDQLIEILEESLVHFYPEATNLPQVFEENHVRAEFIVLFEEGNLAKNCQHYAEDDLYVCEKSLLGINYGGNEIYLVWRDCLARSALAHELLHSVENYILGLSGPSDHLTPWLFWEYDVENYMGDGDYIIEVDVAYKGICALGSCENIKTEWCK